MSLDFKQVEQVLAMFAGIHPERRSAFVSRLKQWQKSGFPDGVNVGRGVKASYGATQLYQLALCLSLMQVGLTPERAHQIVRQGWTEFRRAIVEATICLSNRAGHLHYVLVKFEALTDLTDPDVGHAHLYVKTLHSNLLADALHEYSDEDFADWSAKEREGFEIFQFAMKNAMARTVFLEVDSILLRLWAFGREAGLKAVDLKAEVAEWEREFREEQDRRADDNATVTEPASLIESRERISALLDQFDASKFAFDTISGDWIMKEQPNDSNS